MLLSDFDYCLPKELIAQKPCRPRDHSRLLVIIRKSHKIIHSYFYQLNKFLAKGDMLVLNDSQVIPARLIGQKSTGGRVEILLIKSLNGSNYFDFNCLNWLALLKNYKNSEKKIIFLKNNCQIEPIKYFGNGLWKIQFSYCGERLRYLIYQYGQAPLPPYIKTPSSLDDYQTIYAQKKGSIAAPTAGFHFTNRVFDSLKKKGILTAKITLHVGLGTFQPVRSRHVEDHSLESEQAEISYKTSQEINRLKKQGGQIIAVGTTSVRTLESFASKDNYLDSGVKDVNLFIYPGYRFKIIDGMLTNFHLPKSTPFLLVCALAGRSIIMQAYQEAIKKRYRFFSFGDSMLII